MDFGKLIEPELLITVPVLYLLGVMIKKSNVSDRFIPLILGAMGIILATVYKLTLYSPNGFNSVAELIFAGVTQGILCAAGSVYTDNLIRQFKKKDDENDDPGDK